MAIRADHKRHIVIFAVITALCLLGDSMLYIVLPVHYQDMGVSSLWEVGVILAVNRIVRLPLNPCIGWLYARISERTGIFIAVALATATTFSYGFLPGFAFWILARCVWGVAWTLLRLGSLFCIFNLSGPDNRGRYTGLYNGLYRLGSLVGMLLGGVLADLAGIVVTVMVLGTATALAMLLALVRIPRGDGRREDREAAGSGVFADLALAARDRSTFRLMGAGCLTALVFQGVVASSLSRLIAVHTDGGLSLCGVLIGASILGGFFQALRWGWEPWLAPLTGRLFDRFGQTRMLRSACILGAVSFVALASPLPLALWFPCILFMQASATMLTTVSDAAAAAAASHSGGRTLLMAYSLIVDTGAALGPLAAYGMNALWGINAAYAGCAALFVMLLVGRRTAGRTVA